MPKEVHNIAGSMTGPIPFEQHPSWRFPRPWTTTQAVLLAHPDGAHFYLATPDGVELRNVYTGAVVRTDKHHPETVFFLALHPDGKHYVSACERAVWRVPL